MKESSTWPIKRKELAPSHRVDNQRNFLFGSNQVRKNDESSAKATASEAVAIQKSLLRTQKLLEHELDRVSTFQSVLNDDGKLLQQAMDTQKSLNVKGAKMALTALQMAQQKERRVLRWSIFFFWMCAFYVLWCRIVTKIPFVDQLVGFLQYELWVRLFELPKSK
jgi:hypothetical protein